MYPAFDTVGKRLVCLKLYWRTETTTRPPELDVYRRLYDAGVRNIAKPITGGALVEDGGYQHTPAQQHLSKDNPLGVRWGLHCMVTETLGRPLKSFEDQKILFNCLMNAFDGKRRYH